MQAGGQRFDPAQLHQLIRCFLIAAIFLIGDADQETGRSVFEDCPAGFHRPRAGLLETQKVGCLTTKLIG